MEGLGDFLDSNGTEGGGVTLGTAQGGNLGGGGVKLEIYETNEQKKSLKSTLMAGKRKKSGWLGWSKVKLNPPFPQDHNTNKPTVTNL